MTQSLQKSYEQNKYDEIIQYLESKDKYWLENDIWDINKNINMQVQKKD